MKLVANYFVAIFSFGVVILLVLRLMEGNYTSGGGRATDLILPGMLALGFLCVGWIGLLGTYIYSLFFGEKRISSFYVFLIILPAIGCYWLMTLF